MAKVASLKAQKEKHAGNSTQAEIEQPAESSTMAEIGNAINTFSISQEIEMTEESDNHFVLPGEDNLLRSNCWTFSQNQRRTSVRGSDETMAVPANEQGSSTNSYPNVAHGPQETNPGASNSFPTHASNEGLLHGSLEDGIVNLDSNQPNTLNTPLQQHQTPATSSPTLAELIDWIKAEPDFAPTWNLPSPPREYATEPDTIALRDSLISPPISPAPINRTAGDSLTPLPVGLWSPQVPLERSSPPQVSFIPAQSFNDEELMDDIQAANHFMSEMMVWPESPSSGKNPSED
ncbi:hypothetical protein MMC29_000453 [Sticta canariensis]|nr:hypothetical protein [Sticta canariensis]